MIIKWWRTFSRVSSCLLFFESSYTFRNCLLENPTVGMSLIQLHLKCRRLWRNNASLPTRRQTSYDFSCWIALIIFCCGERVHMDRFVWSCTKKGYKWGGFMTLLSLASRVAFRRWSERSVLVSTCSVGVAAAARLLQVGAAVCVGPVALALLAGAVLPLETAPRQLAALLPGLSPLDPRGVCDLGQRGGPGRHVLEDPRDQSAAVHQNLRLWQPRRKRTQVRWTGNHISKSGRKCIQKHLLVCTLKARV